MSGFHLPGTPVWLGWAHPGAFFLLLLLAPLWWLWTRRRRSPVIRFSSLGPLREAGAGGGARARLLLPVLRTIALLALILAVARPQRADESSRVFAEGVAVQLVVDVSSSMQDYDLSPPEKRLDRLAIVKEVVRQFVLGKKAGGDLPGRPNDLIGLIRFARYADSVCPLTLDHDNLVEQLEATHWIGEDIFREMQRLEENRGSQRRYSQLAEQFRQLNNTEDGTAIGAGLALAVERLKDLKRTTGAGEQLKIRSRIVILLTDGENNVEEIERRIGGDPMLITMSPVQAGELAAAEKIRVYTIAAGTGAVEYRQTFTGQVVPSSRRPLNDADLRTIAEKTGGKHFVASDRESLKSIYEEIDALERSKLEERSYVRWSELSNPLLLAAFAALTLQTLLDATRLRKIP